MSASPQIRELMRRQAEADVRVAVDRGADVPQTSMDEGAPFNQQDISLSDLSTETKVVPTTGYELTYRRSGSAPAGRLDVSFGGVFKSLAPGDKIRGFFRGFSVSRASGSSSVGNAALVITTRPDVHFEEPPQYAGKVVDPTDLLGVASVPTFRAVAEDTQPAGAAPVGSFDVTGWKRIRVLVDGQAANTLTSADIVPWYRDPVNGLWFEQGTEIVSLPDSISTGYRYRVFILNVAGNGLMYLEIRNLLPAGQTQLGFIVQGIE